MQAARRIACRSSVTQLNYCRRVAIRYQRLLIRSAVLSNYQPSYSTSTDVIPPPFPEGVEKQYSPKIEQLVTDIGKLTLLEVADLNELLKKSLNIQDAPMMAMGAMPATSVKEEEDEEAEPKREKTSFTVKLTQFDAGKKVQLIKEIKNVVEGLNLVQAKKFVESVPQVVRADISKEEAEKLKETLISVGAQVDIE